MDQKEQFGRILNFLNMNRYETITLNMIEEKFKNQIHLKDIKRNLDHMLDLDLITAENLSYEGITLSVLEYSLTSYGIQEIEKALKQGLKPLDEKKIKQEDANLRIFKNQECFNFFISLKEDVRERYQLSDYSFIFRRMQKDEYINKFVVDEEFRDFLSEKYGKIIGKTKLLEYCKTDMKENNYTFKKLLFKGL